MKLIVETDSPKKEARYQRAFYTLIRELGIEHMPHKVWLTFNHEKPEVKPDFLNGEFGIIVNQIKGETHAHIVDGYLKMRINEWKNSCDCKQCRNMPNQEPMETFCHEMVHVKQMVLRELVSMRIGVVWKGKRFWDIPDYDDMPWEHEAFKLQKSLYRKVLKAEKMLEAA